jgi:hypothetical protein
LEGRGFSERLGAPEVLIYETDEEIVARDCGAYPKKFGMWRDSFDRTVAELFGIHAESYSVWLVKIQLCYGWIVFRVWYCCGQNCRMNHREATRQDKAKQIRGIKINRKWNNRVDKAFGYKLFVTITHPSILKLHWWHLILSCWYSPTISDQRHGF